MSDPTPRPRVPDGPFVRAPNGTVARDTQVREMVQAGRCIDCGAKLGESEAKCFTVCEACWVIKTATGARLVSLIQRLRDDQSREILRLRAENETLRNTRYDGGEDIGARLMCEDADMLDHIASEQKKGFASGTVYVPDSIPASLHGIAKYLRDQAAKATRARSPEDDGRPVFTNEDVEFFRLVAGQWRTLRLGDHQRRAFDELANRIELAARSREEDGTGE